MYSYYKAWLDWPLLPQWRRLQNFNCCIKEQTPLIKNLTAIHILWYKNTAKQHSLSFISEFGIMQGISWKFTWIGYDGTVNKTKVVFRCNRRSFFYTSVMHLLEKFNFVPWVGWSVLPILFLTRSPQARLPRVPCLPRGEWKF